MNAEPLPKANTFSICAVDPETGEAGVAVASKCLAVGGLVAYAEPGVGAIATQACINPYYGTQGLRLLRKGIPAAQVVQRLTREDVTITGTGDDAMELYGRERLTEEGKDFFRDTENGRLVWLTHRIRQLGVVDRQGHTANHNGARISPWSGSIHGKNFCVQGNLLAGEQVITAMAEAFTRDRTAPMVKRLMDALEAGEAAGGDKRGKQAAGMLVVRHRAHWTLTDDYCNIRVDDHEEPVAELKRILTKIGMLGSA
jgi:uncharacterized Ntn-hydrolase superfamily protein